MGMSITVHTDNVKEFAVTGTARVSEYSGAYPVLKIKYQDAKNTMENDITFFPTIEQLEEIKKEINSAIREYKKLTTIPAIVE